MPRGDRSARIVRALGAIVLLLMLAAAAYAASIAVANWPRIGV